MSAFFATLLLVFVALPLFAGDGTWSRDALVTKFYESDGQTIRFTCEVDSVDTLTSSAFNLREYDKPYWGPRMYRMKPTGGAIDTTFNLEDKPFSYRLSTTSALGAPKITAYLYGSFFKDTLFTVIDTLCTDRVSETASNSTIDLNNQKYPWYQLKVYGIALCRTDAIFDWVLYCYQKQ